MTNTVPSTETTTAGHANPDRSIPDHVIPSAPATVPDVGETFTRDEQQCVVTAWLKRVPTQPLPDELAALFPNAPAHPPLLVFCVRTEAEFVSAYCGHGLVVPVDQAVITGRARWVDVHFDHARRRAQQLIGSYAYAT